MMARLIALVTTPFSRTAFNELLGVLKELKDEQATEYSDKYGKTLVWDEETGKVLLTVRKFAYVSVNVTIKTTPLWEEYMDDRERNGIRTRFYFDQFEDVFEFRVKDFFDLVCAAREMRHLNWLRLNWLQQKTNRRVVLAMGRHSRLGADSLLAGLDDGILQIVASML